MLRIDGKKIGDVVEITFISLYSRVVSQEYINARRAVMHATSITARPGDRCMVRIVGEDLRNLEFLVKVESIVANGDGERSHLQKVLEAIDTDDEVMGINVQQALLSILASDFQGNGQRHLEFLLDILESRAVKLGWCRPLNYPLFAAEIKRLIIALHPNNPLAQAGLFLRAVEHCDAEKAGVKSAIHLLEEVLHLCENGAGDLLVQTLRSFCSSEAEAESVSSEQFAKEGDWPDERCIMRYNLARLMLKDGSIEEVRRISAMLEPVSERLRTTKHAGEVSFLLREASRRLNEKA